MLRIVFVTLFPELTLGAARHSILKRAEEDGLVSFEAVDPRTFTHDVHRTVDETPYGGGPGMVMKIEPVAAAIRSLHLEPNASIILTDPNGEVFDQRHAIDLANEQEIVILCGHYGGMDGRIGDLFATHRFSIGDFVLTGGELPALVMTDAIVRNLPGALGSAKSLDVDAHRNGLLSAPQYTRPEVFEESAIPPVLKSGNHKEIDRWSRRQSLELTRRNRPDLFWRSTLENGDADLLKS